MFPSRVLPFLMHGMGGCFLVAKLCPFGEDSESECYSFQPSDLPCGPLMDEVSSFPAGANESFSVILPRPGQPILKPFLDVREMGGHGQQLNQLVAQFNSSPKLIFFEENGVPEFCIGLGERKTDRIALLSIKDQLVGAYPGALDSWNASLHFCEWQGVTCGSRHQRVTALDLDGLKLDLQGNIPKEVGYLRRLRVFELFRNNLHGTIPVELANCSNLLTIRLSHNNLTGEVPFQLGDSSKLIVLSLGANNLIGGWNGIGGSVPNNLGNLKNLQQFMIAGNYLGNGNTGDLDFLSSLSNCSLLQILDLEANRLGGPLPESIGNLSIQLNMLFMGWNQISGNIPEGIGNLVSLTLLHLPRNALEGTLPTSLGKLRNLERLFLEAKEKLVAVKVLNLQNRGAAKSFMAECKALGKVRHRNVLKIITSCSSIDYQGKDFKALVFEFIPNWSLDSWLHEQHESSDFGLAKLLSSDTNNMGNDQTEYGMGGAVSPEGDIYGYGTLLLEMITGRRPTDGTFHGGLSLHNFCKMALPERLKEILDFRLLEQISENNERLTS
ncbi:PREDICTED: putative receptor-like protein kinase At3g47110 [Theobroma cacao]|uniref:Receptor-like protein kinase At3g47110 n=1 Tax=Theobroma cacao TaxID=3641 RepID=A0AB32WYG1_THECC|nr:PREDICTED: putative receptor-like protein kinase At3g47110 [Theobroma cacao]